MSLFPMNAHREACVVGSAAAASYWRLVAMVFKPVAEARIGQFP